MNAPLRSVTVRFQEFQCIIVHLSSPLNVNEEFTSAKGGFGFFANRLVLVFKGPVVVRVLQST